MALQPLGHRGGPAPASARHSDGLAAEAVRQQLARVLDSETFQGAPRLAAVLGFVVDERLAGRSKDLKERTIAVRALQRPAGFDPRSDPAVRVLAGRLRSALDLYYRTAGAADPIVISVPKGGYVPVFEPRPASAAAGLPAPAPSPSRSPRPVLAVVRFGDLGSSADRSYVAAGITEAVVGALSHFEGCEVVGPLAATDADEAGQAAAAARRLGADFTLFGSTRVRDERLRVTARLVHAPSGELVWSAQLDRSLQDASVLEVEDGISREVAAAVADDHGVIHRSGRVPTGLGEPCVYDAMLQYFALLDDLAPARIGPTCAALERATGVVPDDASLLGMLAYTLVLEHLHLRMARSPQLDRARDLVTRATALDPRSQQAATARAAVAYADGDLARLEREVDRLVAGHPGHPTALWTAGAALATAGAWDRGVGLVRESMRLNPRHPAHWHWVLALDAYRRDELDEALTEAGLVGGVLPFGPLARTLVLARLDRLAGALGELTDLRTRMAGRGDLLDSRLWRPFVVEPGLEALMVADLRRVARAGAAPY